MLCLMTLVPNAVLGKKRIHFLTEVFCAAAVTEQQAHPSSSSSSSGSRYEEVGFGTDPTSATTTSTAATTASHHDRYGSFTGEAVATTQAGSISSSSEGRYGVFDGDAPFARAPVPPAVQIGSSASEFWKENLGDQKSVSTSQVRELFTKALPLSAAALPDLTTHVIANNATKASSDIISLSLLEGFARLFGGWPICFSRATETLCAPDGSLHTWFHGQADRQQAQDALRGRPCMFLLRYKTERDALVLVRTKSGAIRHDIITVGAGWSFVEVADWDSKKMVRYPSLAAIVDALQANDFVAASRRTVI